MNTQPALADAPHKLTSTFHHSSYPKSTRTLPDITTKISAQSASDHGHLEDHQRLIKRRSKAARKEEQEGSKEPAEPVQAGQDHHKIQIKKEKGTRTKPDTNFSSSKNFSNKVNKSRTSSSICSYHL
jgi:hypothetical protein